MEKCKCPQCSMEQGQITVKSTCSTQAARCKATKDRIEASNVKSADRAMEPVRTHRAMLAQKAMRAELKQAKRKSA